MLESEIGSLEHMTFLVISFVASSGIFISYYYFDIMETLREIKEKQN